MDLSAKGITVERGGQLALTAPEFVVRTGEAAVLTGPNGAGKSTLLRALAGLLPMSAGEAKLGDLQLSSDREAFGEMVAYAGHLDAVKPALTVRANLASWVSVYCADPEGIDPALTQFSLDHIADTPAGYCSAGQKRRLGLARLLVMGRPLWLLDEPTVSLDTKSTQVFAKAVVTHCESGGIAVAATHIDLGLPQGPRIALEPPSATGATDTDPFLSDNWG
ncbi:MAG: heme ABC exporter ATP-binding protein CcmA [Pikeienuella sp.]